MLETVASAAVKYPGMDLRECAISLRLWVSLYWSDCLEGMPLPANAKWIFISIRFKSVNMHKGISRCNEGAKEETYGGEVCLRQSAASHDMYNVITSPTRAHKKRSKGGRDHRRER